MEVFLKTIKMDTVSKYDKNNYFILMKYGRTIKRNILPALIITQIPVNS